MIITFFIIAFILCYGIGFVNGKLSLLGHLRRGEDDINLHGEKEFDKLQEGLYLNEIYERRRTGK